MNKNNLPTVYFYIPQTDWPTDYLPDSPDTYWSWMQSRYCLAKHNLTYQYLGRYNWTLQTYLHLKAAGFSCQLIDHLPSEGIVIAHRNFLPFYLRPSSQVLLVCIKADYETHPYAQLQIVQNIQETKTFSNSYFIPYWPQPSLIPRDPKRGNRFESIAYYGLPKNLAPELQTLAWAEQLASMGFQWRIVLRENWNDYSQVDAVLAVRDFEQPTDYPWKPASKLTNAWLAGVPAILGRESAYQTERQSKLDYIEVSSLEETLTALKRLRDNLSLRQAMVKQGQQRGESRSTDVLVQQWQQFFEDVAFPAWVRWCSSSRWSQKLYLARCRLEIQEKHRRPLSQYAHDLDLDDIKHPTTEEQLATWGLKLYKRSQQFFGLH
ncbi:MAG: hypothetical protein F6J96_16300 [Symploca sp. SIO1C2]|nr:hypothetical protein [Symploca sp. SIO1C2]